MSQWRRFPRPSTSARQTKDSIRSGAKQSEAPFRTGYRVPCSRDREFSGPAPKWQSRPHGHYDWILQDIPDNEPPFPPVDLRIGAIAGKSPYGKQILADHQETAQNRHPGEARFPNCVISNRIGHVSNVSVYAVLKKSPAPVCADRKDANHSHA